MGVPRYRRNAGSVYSLNYHLVWCPKYRCKVLVGEIADELRLLLFEKAQALAVTIEALEMMPDIENPRGCESAWLNCGGCNLTPLDRSGAAVGKKKPTARLLACLSSLPTQEQMICIRPAIR